MRRHRALLMALLLFEAGCSAFQNDEPQTEHQASKFNVTQTYRVDLDMPQSFAELIAAGDFEWVSREINAENFPLSKERDEVDLQMVEFQGTHLNTQEVLKALYEGGLRPATFHELLALSISQPQLPLSKAIVALGSKLYRRNVDKYPVLIQGGRGRVLRLSWVGRPQFWMPHDLKGWDLQQYNFLAVQR